MSYHDATAKQYMLLYARNSNYLFLVLAAIVFSIIGVMYFTDDLYQSRSKQEWRQV